MKTTLIFIMLVQGVLMSVKAQTHLGTGAGTAGTNHSYFGYYAGHDATSSSSSNSFFGAFSGRNTTTGFSNTALGSGAQYHNIVGRNSTAVGVQALYANTEGWSDVAIGRAALFTLNNSFYSQNTANGFRALYAAIGSELSGNTATGALALRHNTTGRYNNATGFQSLFYNITGGRNVATGAYALHANTTGRYNVAYGIRALSTSDTSSYNSAFGSYALYSESTGNCVGSDNTAFGAFAGPAAEAGCNINNATAIGYNAKFTASNQVRIGNADIVSIGGQVSWSILSDGRFKKDVKKDVAGLEFIAQLNPVSYTLDNDAFNKFLKIPDSLVRRDTQTRKAIEYQVGFVAQEVEAVVKKSGYVFSGVEAPENENAAYAIRYAEFVVPLVKAVQELSIISDGQQKEIEQLQLALSQHLEDSLTGGKQTADETLFQNNFNQIPNTIEIHFQVPNTTTRANLIIYSLDGNQLKDIQVEERGNASINISRDELRPGLYWYALVADGQVVVTDQIAVK